MVQLFLRMSRVNFLPTDIQTKVIEMLSTHLAMNIYIVTITSK